MAVAIRLLGTFEIDDVPTGPVPAEAWTRRQAAALVKLLAITPNRQLHREQVIDALWPDLSVEEAAPRLHKAAHYARKVLGTSSAVALRGDVLALLPDDEVVVDAFTFDDLAERAVADGTAAAAEAAIDTYGGDLLPHDLYEPWSEDLRERLRLRHLQLLRQAGRWDDLLEVDPADEDAHLALMQARAAAGDRRGALLQYERMERALERDLGVAPSEAAVRLRDDLLAAGPEPPSTPGPAAPHAPAASPAAPGGASHGWPLVGRGEQLELIAGRFADPRIGGILLTGGAGVGKTRLADECLQAASAAGLATARIAGHPGARPVALAALAHLLPPEVTAVETRDRELDRAALFHRARSAITRAVPTGQRLLLLVDDADQLDDLSQALVASLAVERAAFVVLTVRSGGEPIPSIHHLVKDGHLDRLELDELDVDSAEALLYRVLEGPMLADSLRQVVDASLGNPGILRQLVETAREAGTLACSHGVWELTGPLQPPASLEALVAERLEGIEGASRHALQLLAVAGELGLQVLTDLVGDEPVEALDARGVLMLRTDGRRTDIGLAHPIFGEVVRQQLPALAGRRLRRELAAAIEARGARRRDDQFRIVAWRLDGGGHVDEPLLVRAARLALIEGRDQIAARLLDCTNADRPTPEALQLRAELHFRRGDAARAEELLASIDPGSLADDRHALIARRRANNRFYATMDPDEPERLLDGTRPHLHDPEALRCLDATLAMILATAGRVHRSVELAEAALPDATGTVRLELLRALGMALPASGRCNDALDLIREGRLLHEGLEADVALPGRTMLLFAEVVALTELGRIDEARRAAEHSRRRRTSVVAGWLDIAQGRLELLAGRPRTTRRVLSPIIHDSRVRGAGSTERWLLALHASAWLLEGEVSRAENELARVAELEDGTRANFHNEIDRAHAWLAAARGRPDQALSSLEASADDCRARGATGMEVGLLHDMVRFGAAAAVGERLIDVCAAVQGGLSSARATHATGLLAADAGLLEKAATEFAEAGADLLAAEAAAGAAEVLRETGRLEQAAVADQTCEELRVASGVRLVTPALP